MYAFFNSVPEKGLDGRTGNADPILQMTNPLQKTNQTGLEAAVKPREHVLNDAYRRHSCAGMAEDPKLPAEITEGLEGSGPDKNKSYDGQMESVQVPDAGTTCIRRFGFEERLVCHARAERAWLEHLR